MLSAPTLPMDAAPRQGALHPHPTWDTASGISMHTTVRKLPGHSRMSRVLGSRSRCLPTRQPSLLLGNHFPTGCSIPLVPTLTPTDTKGRRHLNAGLCSGCRPPWSGGPVTQPLRQGSLLQRGPHHAGRSAHKLQGSLPAKPSGVRAPLSSLGGCSAQEQPFLQDPGAGRQGGQSTQHSETQ